MYGSVNVPGASAIEQKAMLARVKSIERTLNGAEKITGTTDPTGQTVAQVGQIYINTITGEEWKCIAVNENGTVWEKLTSSSVGLTATDIGAVPESRKVNGKALTTDISLTAADVGAAASGHTHQIFAAQSSAPSDTRLLWIDTTANTGGLKYWNGSAWVPVPVAYT